MEDDNFSDLDKWLTSNGIGLELQVAGAFRKKYAKDQVWTQIQHSYQYHIPRSEDNQSFFRETDVVITKSKRLQNDLLVTVRLVIECKHGAGTPIVLYKEYSQVPYFDFNSLDELWVCSKSPDIDTKNLFGVNENNLLSGGNNKACYSINSVYLNGKNNSKFDAQNSIKQLASGLAGVLEQTIHDPMSKSNLQILIPILLTKSPIYTLELDEEGNIKRETSKRELLVWRTNPNQERSQGFWVIHFDALDELIEDYDKFFQELDYRQF